MLNSHTEEMRVQQARYKQLRAQHKETAARLKERDAQLQQLRDEHQHLLDLTKDKYITTHAILNSLSQMLNLAQLPFHSIKPFFFEIKCTYA